MALPWTQIRDAKATNPEFEAALRRWAVWLKIEGAEGWPLKKLITELSMLGYIYSDDIPRGYY